MLIENVYTYITNHEATCVNISINMRWNQILLQVAAILLLVLLHLKGLVQTYSNIVNPTSAAIKIDLQYTTFT